MEQNVILNAKDSDPEKLKWMMGFPPEKEKIISAKDGSFFEFPALRYSVNHMREFFPTRKVSANKNWNYRVTKKIDNNIENITYVPWDSNESKTFLEGLDNYEDYDIRKKSSDDFSKLLMEDTCTFYYDFPYLTDSTGIVNIATSDDGNIRIYSWDTQLGGTMIRWDNVIQYRSNGRLKSFEGNIT